MDNFVKDLNKEQVDAVMQLNGPVLVIAGAGSGKTKTLTYRIGYLIKNENINPENILAITFTNKAAKEMKERVISLIGDSALPFIGTFHSMCVKFLKKDGENIGIKSNFNIFDTSDSVEAIREAMNQAGISTKDYSPNKVHNLISSCKNELISPTEYSNFARLPIQIVASQVYPIYQTILKDSNSMDFDDLIMRTVELFTHKEILEKYQDLFKYILVDEYQDTNHAQYMLVKMLAKKNRNIYCVGDPDQNIYTFRGATIDNILNFETDYPDCKVIKLEQNYRSTKNILKAAHNVISKNEKRKEKEMWTDNNEGEKIKRYIASSEQDEAIFIAKKVKEKYNYAEDVVLYRTNAQSRALEEVFLEYQIPYKLVGGLRFYERREIKDIISFLRLVNNTKDNISLKRIINVPPRKIGKKTIEVIEDLAYNSSQSIMDYMVNNDQSINPKLKDFTKIIKRFLSFISSNEITLSHFINIIIKDLKYIEYLELEDESALSRIENIQELNTVASRYDDLPLEDALSDFLQEVSLVEQESKVNDSELGAVTLMSVHSAKGLEFNTVFLVGMEEGLFPHINSIYSQDDIEEERRLCYVGMTRAKKELYLINAESRTLYGMRQSNPLSRFLKDIPPELFKFEEKAYSYSSSYQPNNNYDKGYVSNINFAIGDKVLHPVFKEGYVINLSGDMITIRFFSYGEKKLMTSYTKGMKKI